MEKMNNYWETNSILNNQTDKTPPREIYQAACDAIGEHFKNKGFKYSKSFPKISFKDKEFKLEILFTSSGSNCAGEYVNLEINAYLYSLEVIKNKIGRGFLNSTTAPLCKKLKGNYEIGTKIVKQVNGEEIRYVEKTRDFNEITYNRNVNLYGMDEKLFEQIINFIEIRIIQWLRDIVNPDKTMELLDDCGVSAKLGLKRTNFLDYFKLKHPEIVNLVEEKLKTNR